MVSRPEILRSINGNRLPKRQSLFGLSRICPSGLLRDENVRTNIERGKPALTHGKKQIEAETKSLPTAERVVPGSCAPARSMLVEYLLPLAVQRTFTGQRLVLAVGALRGIALGAGGCRLAVTVSIHF